MHSSVIKKQNWQFDKTNANVKYNFQAAFPARRL
jgi:hypothetical protein